MTGPREASSAGKSGPDSNSANGDAKSASAGQVWDDGQSETVLAQVGLEQLPIQSLADLPDLNAKLRHNAETLVKAAPTDNVSYSAAAVAAARAYLETRDSDLLRPIETIIAGKEYRLYPYPIKLKQKEGVSPQTYLIVGVMPARSSVMQLDLDDAELLAFGLLTALLLALAPFLRLANLGPVDGVKPIERAALGLGLVLVAALATGLCVLGWDSMREKAREDLQLTTTADKLADAIANDLRLFAPDAKPSMRRMESGWTAGGKDPDIVKYMSSPASPTKSLIRHGVDASDKPPPPPPLPEPEIVFFMDEEGHQPDCWPTTTYSERASILYNSSDRSYFQQARDGDAVPGTTEDAGSLAARLGPAMASPQGYGLELVQARNDGLARAVLTIGLPKNWTGQGRWRRARELSFGREGEAGTPGGGGVHPHREVDARAGHPAAHGVRGGRPLGPGLEDDLP